MRSAIFKAKAKLDITAHHSFRYLYHPTTVATASVQLPVF